MNYLAEVGVEDGVDDRVEGGVEVAQPGDEHVHLHIWFCIWCCICICISNFLFVFVFVVWNFKLDVYPASGEFGEISNEDSEEHSFLQVVSTALLPHLIFMVTPITMKTTTIADTTPHKMFTRELSCSFLASNSCNSEKYWFWLCHLHNSFHHGSYMRSIWNPTWHKPSQTPTLTDHIA